MKISSVLFLAIMASTQVFGQQNDTMKVAQDTIPKPVANTAKTVKKDNRPLKEKIALGFGSSFWITPHETYVELSPVIAYRFPKRLITGVGYRYIYRRERVAGEDLNSWGPNVFARLGLLKRVYLWTEYEYLNTQYLNEVLPDEYNRQKTHSDSWFAGLGYVRSLGRKGRGGISVQVLYNMLYNRDDFSPYYSPVTYRVGYYF
jgi:hypothetical protein